MVCQICNKDCGDLNNFLTHLKTHKISRERYFIKYLPRYDKNTGEQIKFKNADQYLYADFNDKRSMKSWLSKVSKIEACEYLKNKLFQYCLDKKMEYAPSQAELKLIASLPIAETFEFFGGKPFDQICADLNLKNRFQYQKMPAKQEKVNKIIIDTREQRKLDFPNIKVYDHCLPYGDYATNLLPKVSVERKSAADGRSTLSKGYDRFVRECERAKESRAILVMVFESPINTVLYADKWGKASPEFLSHRLRELTRNFPNLQLLFCNDRKDAVKCIISIFEMGDSVKDFDLEYLYNKGLLC